MTESTYLKSSENINISDQIDERIKNLSRSLLDTSEILKSDKTTATQKQILIYLGVGLTIATSFFAPKAASTLSRDVYKALNKRQSEDWKKFNTRYLKQSLKRLEEQKIVERVFENNQEILKISKKGITKILKFALTEIKIKKSRWDGKWRIIVYDIETGRKSEQQAIRRILKSIGFYQMQKSVYLFPYHCFDEVEYIRSYYDLGDKIIYIVADSIENDAVYKQYFGV